MKQLSTRRTLTKVALLAAVLGLTWALSTGPAKSEILNSATRQYTGYTRPGSPSDKVEGGKIVWAANVDKGILKNGIGGTIYFAVFDMTGGAQGDVWGTGVKDFDTSFKPGLDFAGESSPTLDTSARYLYLYQVVNDRGTETPVRSTSLKLFNPESLTSWGYFAGYSFALKGTVQDAKGKALTFPGGEATAARDLVYVAVGNKAVSGTKLPTPYQLQSPAIFDIRPRVNTFFNKQDIPVLEKKGVKLMNNLPVIEPLAVKGRDPNYVLIGRQLDFGTAERGEYVGAGMRTDEAFASVRANEAYTATFRAVWTTDNLLLKEEMSPIYGFTSNLPPVIAPLRLQGWHREAVGKNGGKVLPMPKVVEPGDKKIGKVEPPQVGKDGGKKDGVLPAGQGDGVERLGVGNVLPVANGSVPTPAGAPAAAAAGGGIASVGTVGTLGGTTGGGGGFGAPIGGLGGIGAATPPIFGGGGVGGNSGTGSNSGTGNNQGTGAATQSQQQPININNNNFNTLQQQQTQQQQQQQQQQQRQNQHQHQNQHGHHGHVVPEPGAYLLLLLGLPALLLFRRRNLNPAPLAN